ncbi:MAG: hypothetical protein JWP97_1847 [Labilithrix sp.]|nr:hypothetical protein [Labilithrix sp.]
MNVHRALVSSALSLVAACHAPSPSAATTAASPPTVVVAPVVAAKDAGERMPERASGVAWTTRLERLGTPGCGAPFSVPVVTQPAPLAASVTAWVDEELAAARSLLSDATGCRPLENEARVAVRRVHGFVTVSFELPPSLDAKFSLPRKRTFSFRTGKAFESVVVEAKRDLLFQRLLPRYRAAMVEALREPDLSPDCAAVVGQYSPQLDDFTVSERGFSFSGWSSLPMWAAACYPGHEPVLTAAELEGFLDPEALAAWGEPFGP